MTVPPMACTNFQKKGLNLKGFSLKICCTYQGDNEASWRANKVSNAYMLVFTLRHAVPNSWEASSRSMQWFDRSSLGRGASIRLSSNSRMLGLNNCGTGKYCIQAWKRRDRLRLILKWLLYFIYWVTKQGMNTTRHA